MINMPKRRAPAHFAQPVKTTPVEMTVETIVHRLEPIREVWIHGEGFAASRLSMMRIMARRMNAATVVV